MTERVKISKIKKHTVPGPGRPPGQKNKKTIVREAQLEQQMQVTGKLPHMIMLDVAQCPTNTELAGWGLVTKDDRKWACQTVACYFASKAPTQLAHSGQLTTMFLPPEIIAGLSEHERTILTAVFSRLQQSASGATQPEVSAAAYESTLH